MEITQYQKDILNSFVCERLSSKRDNLDLIKEFKSERGAGLVSYLVKNGWDEDDCGKVAFYIIKNKDNLPCVFFSLKCGALFEPMDQNGFFDELQKSLLAIQNEIKINPFSNGQDGINNFIFRHTSELVRDTGVSFEQAYSLVGSLLNSENDRKMELIHSKHIIKNILSNFHKEDEQEGERPILRVHKTMPGVELMHFCTNDNAKDYWKELGFNHPMGEVMFWNFIAPKIKELQSLVGCQYMFLFAADNTRDGTLINYYKISLKFDVVDGIGTSKPLYDIGCVFMSQEANELITNHEYYFQNFNIDESAEDVI